ncbi:unnamed protein product [Porites lobata]|uniref:Uncharacterized protein n=1 Tax=Porites lobata TaxID=104759 RepID=A0ABN8MVA8_9CNID|nr:unnamed protein product [Porites lobata]
MFEANKPDNNYSAINTKITNLLNLPVETNLPPISKVFVGYPSSSQVAERSCEDK